MKLARIVLLALPAWLVACAPAATAPSPSPTLPPATDGFPGGIGSASGPVQSGFTRYSGQVLDAASGKPLQWVCVYAGPPSGCPTPSLVTDASGRWTFDFPSGLTWPFNFEHPMYEPVTQLTGVTLEVKLKPKS